MPFGDLFRQFHPLTQGAGNLPGSTPRFSPVLPIKQINPVNNRREANSPNFRAMRKFCRKPMVNLLNIRRMQRRMFEKGEYYV